MNIHRLWGCFFLLPFASSLRTMMIAKPLVRVSENAWRAAVSQHVSKIQELLQPGLTSPDDSINSGSRRQGSKTFDPWLTALDPKHPVYNFLVEYYGLKGQKGTRRLARWSPKPELLMQRNDQISDVNQLLTPLHMESEPQFGGILLEGATEEDLGGTLHLRGAIPHGDGIVFSPAMYFDDVEDKSKAASPYMWYRSIIQQTMVSEPILHCHGLHEWAMQYWPEGADVPPSAKYQKHLKLRVSREVLNNAVERRGISCTHVDALRFFSPAAGPLNHHGHSLTREKQLQMEQKACVHVQMDLLKMTMRLEPFSDPILLQQVLELALAARKMDVAASPYDVSAYGVGVIPVETFEGRSEYREQQVALMDRAEPVREEVLQAFNLLLDLGFGENIQDKPAPERYAKAEPGGLPWRKNPIAQADVVAK